MTRQRSAGVIKQLLIGIFLVGLAGCAGTRAPQQKIEPVGPSTPIDLTDSELTKRLLNSQLNAWRGVQYKLGGLSNAGIDCSGFAYMTFLTKFGITLPRTTQSQARIGQAVSITESRPGDLVFFKTGAATRHVGILLDQRRFIHASSSRGVVASSLDNIYWARRYWQVRRIDRQPNALVRTPK